LVWLNVSRKERKGRRELILPLFWTVRYTDPNVMQAGDQIGNYEVLALIGKGGMGEVYRARDKKLGRDVAIKVLPATLAHDPDRLARFEREAKVLAALNHPNIAIIHGLEEQAIVMELVEGPTLADRLEKGPAALEETLAIMRQIADALEAAHEKGVVHRDLKPANVKVREDGTVKVLDFGLATAVQASAREPGNAAVSPTLTLGATEVGVILGTASYMAPEQAAGRVVDKRADIWSFGVVLWEMLTGKRLFQAEDVTHTLADVLRAPISFDALPAGTPAVVTDLLKRCLDRDVKTRLRDIGEARVAIQRCLANPAPPVAESVPLSAPLPSRLGWVLGGIAALFAMAAAGLGYIHFRETPPAEHPLRYTIEAPQGGDVQTATLSPDGRYVVMSAAVNGKRQLWLRQLDALQAQPMPTTDEAAYPFWSPDSRYIGFFAQGKLKKIAASGGPAQSLCDAPTGRGGTWNRDDVIVFSPTNGASGLQRVPAAGGVPADVTRRKDQYRYPVFLPDGRHFLYTARVGGLAAETNGIYLGSLDAQESIRILPDLSQAEFVRSPSGGGYILFVRRNNLMAQPFDAASGRTSGDVFPVAEGVSVSPNDAAVISASETGLLLYGNRGERSGNQLSWFDRAGKILGTASVPGNVLTPAISPDERSIAFKRDDDIWLRDVARGTDIRFTTRGPAAAPFWSPRGDRIAFEYALGAANLYQKVVGGSGEDEVLLVSANSKSTHQWSRDGRFVVYSEVDPKTKRDLWVLPLEGDRKPIPFLRTEFNELLGQLSPDSKWMAYTSDETGTREVYVRPFPPADGKWRISTTGGAMPRWRGDGKELYYADADGKMTAVAVKAVPASVTAKPSFEPSAPVALFESHMIAAEVTDVVFQYDVTADGKRFLIVTSASLDVATSPPLTVDVNWLARLKK